LIEAARFYFRREGLPLSNVDFKSGDASEMTSEKKFDLVFAKDILEHIHEDGKFLRRVVSHLDSQGFIFISTQNSFSLNYLVEKNYQHLIKGQKNWMGWDPAHVRFYNYRALKRLLQNKGMRPVKWVAMYHVPYRFFAIRPRILHIFESRIGKLLHILELAAGGRFPINILGWNIAVLAKKEIVRA
jgi:hypothetical protein